MKALTMKASIHLILLALVATSWGQRTTSTELEAASGEITITPSAGQISQGQVFTLSFPTPMVEASLVEAQGQTCPLFADPALEFRFFWKSPREGRAEIKGPVKPGQTYTLALTPGLTDRQQQPVKASWESVSLTSEPMHIKTEHEDKGPALEAQPEVLLSVNYPVKPTDLIEAAHFMDRETSERVPCELVVAAVDSRAREEKLEVPEVVSQFYLRPRAPLPVDRSFDLVIEGLKDAGTGTPMSGLKAIAVGSTRHLAVESVFAEAPPLRKPFIKLSCSAPVDRASVSKETINVSPPVENLLFVVEESEIRLEGDFQPTQTYQVLLAATVKGTTGFPLAKAVQQQAVFDGLNATIDFPQPQFYQRSALGLDAVALQSNCGEMAWNLAKVPMAQLRVIKERLKEYQDPALDPLTREESEKNKRTELLVDAMGLEVIANGKFPGVGKQEALFRRIQWKPAQGPVASGAYLLEATSRTAKGSTVGNRSLLFFNEVVLTRKFTPTHGIVRVASMETGLPVPNAKIEIVSEGNDKLIDGLTDASGQFSFAREATRRGKLGAQYVLARSEAGFALQPLMGMRFGNSSYVEEEDETPPNAASAKSKLNLRGALVTDRNLYRPGHTVKFKGYARLANDSLSLGLPSGKIDWQITEGYDDDDPKAATGEATLDEFGGWEGEWIVPEAGKLGGYFISFKLQGGEGAVAGRSFQIEEYRVPLFSVEAQPLPTEGEETRFRLQSNYFHGGPNANARVTWTADWTADGSDEAEGYSEDDRHSPDHREALTSQTMQGEARLDAQGSTIIAIKNPYPKPYLAGRFQVTLDASVISPEGRAEQVASATDVFAAPLIAGIKMRRVEEEPQPDLERQSGGMAKKPPYLEITLRATSQDKKTQADIPMSLEVFFVETQTVKEQIGTGVFRYRNFPSYTSIQKLETKSGAKHEVPALKSGYYVALAKLTNQVAPQVSQRVQSNGEGEGYYDVYNEAQIALRADKASYVAGQDTAKLALETPFGGQAWLTLETEGVLDQMLVELPNNSTAISFPIKPEYAPNVFASVYLLKPGGPNHVPLERYGRVELRVTRPDLELAVQPKLTSTSYEPGDQVTGTILVTAGGQPLSNADLTVFAVDEAILRLGLWEMPALAREFYPMREFRVATYRALLDHFERFEEKDVVEKGFVIGGGGMPRARMAADGAEAATQSIRKNFVPLAFWKTGLRTNAQGEVAFEFKAPDNLTSFRVIALAQTLDSRFGESSANFTVAKRFQIEPALPRFARRGDLLELRAVARQSYLDQAEAVIRCLPSEGLEFVNHTREVKVTLAKNVPAVLRFPVRVRDLQDIKVRFEGGVPSDPGIADAVEMTFPARLPGIMQKVGHFGKIADPSKPFDLSGAVPELWKKTEGNFRLTLSNSIFLPEIQSLPEVLDYPHGCFEQKGSRYLAYGIMGQMLDYLPELKSRHQNYAQRLEQGLREYEEALTPDGLIPYWPGGEVGNPWVSVMGYWVMELAKKHGGHIPDKLAAELPKTLGKIIARQIPGVDPTTQAFAMFVLAETGQVNSAPVLQDLLARRNQLSEEALAFVSLTLSKQTGTERELTRIMARLGELKDEDQSIFRPASFGSYWRDWALESLARTRAAKTPVEIVKLRNAFLTAADKDQNVLMSTQENFWKLMVLKEFMERDGAAKIDASKLDPKPDMLSENGVSVAWKELGLEKLREWTMELQSDKPAFFLADAKVLRADEASQQREDRGFRMEREVRNLTQADRKGTPDMPYQIGDELLITYRFEATRNHVYVALTDELPAGIETVNFNLPQVAQFHKLPEGATSDLFLSHSELRDQSANLYFDSVPAGHHQYSVLARVSAAGEFAWPSCQISPMYQPYFYGLSVASRVFSRHDG